MYHELGARGMHPKFQQENPNGMYFSEHLVTERNIILKWILKAERQPA
jgi:hypothetical protein